MDTDSPRCQTLEEVILRSEVGSRLFHAVQQSYGLPEPLFRILLFSSLVYYDESKRPRRPLLGPVLVFAGYVFGALLSILLRVKRTCPPGDSGSRAVVLRDATPNQRKQCGLIRARFRKFSFVELQTFGFADLLRRITSPSSPSALVIGPSFSTVPGAIVRAFRTLPHAMRLGMTVRVPPRQLFTFGLQTSDAVKLVCDFAEELLATATPALLVVTNYSFSSNLIVWKANAQGIRTISWLHGSAGFAIAHRTVCDTTVAQYRDDLPYLRKYSFSREYTSVASCSIRDAARHACQGPEWALVLGYATNLLAGEGPSANTEERYSSNLQSFGHHCNSIIVEVAEWRQFLKCVLKMHPRESGRSYAAFITRLQDHQDVEICSDLGAFVSDMRGGVVVAHPSSVAIDLILSGIPVFIYAPKGMPLDSDSVIARIASAAGFHDASTLLQMLEQGSRNYWAHMMDFFPDEELPPNQQKSEMSSADV